MEEYCRKHLTEAVLPELQALDGFLDAHLLVRPCAEETEVVVAATSELITAVKTFAGAHHERAVVEPVARELLTRIDDHVKNFTVAIAGCR